MNNLRKKEKCEFDPRFNDRHVDIILSDLEVVVEGTRQATAKEVREVIEYIFAPKTVNQGILDYIAQKFVMGEYWQFKLKSGNTLRMKKKP